MRKPWLQTDQLTIEADVANKQVLMQIHPTSSSQSTQLHLAASDCVALLYTFLTINREFHPSQSPTLDHSHDQQTQ